MNINCIISYNIIYYIMSILLTGGLGFIGSHTAVELLNNNYNVIIVDDLSNSKARITAQQKGFFNIVN